MDETMTRKIWLTLAIVFSLQWGYAQPASGPVKELERLFQQFQFKEVLKKGRYFLGEPGISRQDSLAIYEYMLNAAYALNDTARAKAIIDEILNTDPNFQPNPKITSPKIMEFYNWYRRNRRPLFPTKPPGASRDTIPPAQYATSVPMWQFGLSALLPGTGEYLRSRNKNALVRSTISVTLLGGMIYSIVETAHREKAYLNARQNFDTYYAQYNRMYKIRSVTIAAYTGWVFWNMYRWLNSRQMGKYASRKVRIGMVPGISGRGNHGYTYLFISWAL